MTRGAPTTEQWEADNSAYLAAGIAYLRERLGADRDPSQTTVLRDPAARGRRLHSAGPEPWWTDLRWSAADWPPALEVLGDCLGMTRFERLVLLLVVASELSPGLFADEALTPSFGLAMSVLPDPSWSALSPGRTLRYWRLIEISRAYGEPLTTARLGADERIVSFVKGLSDVDDRLGQLCRPVGEPPGDRPPPPSQLEAVDAIVAALIARAPGQARPVVQLIGADELTRRGLAAMAAGHVGAELFELRAAWLPSGAAELEDLARLWRRETLLRHVVLYADVAEATSQQTNAVLRLLEDDEGTLILGAREPWHVSLRAVRLVDVSRPTPEEQQRLWEAELGDGAVAAPLLASEFDLTQVAIRDSAALARTLPADDAVWDACKAQTRNGLETLAQRVVPRATWQDIVLPDAELTLLRRLAEQVRGRATVLRGWGMGERLSRAAAVTALFAGASGTGKTLAAEVLAGELELDLYRIDLSSVVSKYIGETERNLRRVFDAAEEGGALLLFDEADALFGRRSEVKDSHDRYANIEVGYLLQRMEAYRGVAILATNQRQALDAAFMRRLRIVIEFPFPTAAERMQLWERAFSPHAPVGDLQPERLARLPATGGMIANIALNAAFCAAGGEGAITMPLVLEMAQAEFRKLELPVSEADFALEGYA
jgi:ATPase family associated with various cellular activities (AAA)